MGSVEEVSPGIFLLQVPSPLEEVPISSSYLIQGEGGLVLIDPGYPSRATEGLLKEVLAPYGTTPITVLLTHGHVDHYGAAGFLQRAYGARIMVHERDREKVLLGAVQELEMRRQQVQRHWRLLGLGEEIDEIWEGLEAFRRLYARVREVDPLAEGELEIYGLRFWVIPTPGHTSGSCSFYEEGRRILFSGDTLLPPEMETWLSGPAFGEEGAWIEDYREGLRRIAALKPRWVLPGHGEPFRDYKGRIEEIGQRCKRHKDEILKALDEEALTALEVAQRLDVEARGFVRLLVTGQVFSLLGQMESEGLVESSRNGAIHWRRT